jgi:hypothetical protein
LTEILFTEGDAWKGALLWCKIHYSIKRMLSEECAAVNVSKC